MKKLKVAFILVSFSSGIFVAYCLLDKSLYLNLPPALSDTLRQLVVFLLLRYFNTFFSSTNDCKPNDYIFPLRYVIVIDEAHIYLKNKILLIYLSSLGLAISSGVLIYQWIFLETGQKVFFETLIFDKFYILFALTSNLVSLVIILAFSDYILRKINFAKNQKQRLLLPAEMTVRR